MRQFRNILTGIALLAPLSAAWGESVTADMTADVVTGRQLDVTGKADVHITSSSPLVNSTVNLNGEYAWLFLDAVKPTRTVSDYLRFITIDGQPADISTNVRIAEYGAGSVLIPNGIDICNRALTVYTEESFGGDSRTVAIQEPVTDLGKFDNNIRSLRLRKGFIATIANNPDGTGYSRCFIASDNDLEIPVLPEGFVTKDNSGRSFISYIRVMKWQWVSKKGWSGSDQSQMERLNVTHYYGWDAGGPTDRIDREYVPHRHHIGWPGFDQIKSRDNVSHVLGHNEPDNTGDVKEHPASPLEIIREWPEFMRTGLRAGSPAPTSIWGSWLPNFFALADSLNYRVDFVVYHQYEHTADFKSRVNKAVEVSRGRPVWITEWNNGANWTTGNENDWPDKTGLQCDADGNPVENAASVTLPATLANQNVQLEYMKKALANIDACDKLERTNFYTWVQDARSVELNGKKTLAGQYFADYPSKVGFSKASEYEHVWKIAPPLPSLGFSDDFKTARLSWYDHNGETGKSYTVYRCDDDNDTWNPVKTLVLGTDYQAGKTVVFEDPVKCEKRYRYRVRASAYNGEESLYSRIQTVWRDNNVEAVDIRCSASEPTTVRVEWTETDGARAYRLERRLVSSPNNAEGEKEFSVIKPSTTDKSYSDTNVKELSTYAYRVTVLSNAETSPVSDVAEVRTPSLSSAPEGVFNLFAASGDKKVTLVWDKTYRTTWDIERAESETGPWQTVATGVSATTWSDKNVENGSTYYYRLTPDRFGKKGDFSETKTASPQEGNFSYVPFVEGKFFDAYDYFNGGKSTLSSGTYWAEDRHGNAKSAVGLKSGKNAYISLPTGILKTLSDFTISLWLKRTGDNVGRIIDFGSGHNTQMLLDYGYNNKSGFRYKLRVGSKNSNMDASFNLEKNRWYNITLSQEAGTLSLYVDGELVETFRNQPDPSEMGNTNQNWLGRSQWHDNGDPYPDYCYDDFYIFNRAMTGEEVRRLMDAEGVSEVEEIFEAEVVNTEYYGIDGIRIASPAKGTLVIERKTMSNGTVKTSKRIIR